MPSTFRGFARDRSFFRIAPADALPTHHLVEAWVRPSHRRTLQAAYEIDSGDHAVTQANVVGYEEVYPRGGSAGELDGVGSTNGFVLPDAAVEGCGFEVKG